MGMVLMVVHGANIQDAMGAKLLLSKAKAIVSRACGSFGRRRLRAIIDRLGRDVRLGIEIIKRSDAVKALQAAAAARVVERTFGWFGRYRRLSKDYERLPESSEAMVYWAMTRLMARC